MRHVEPRRGVQMLRAAIRLLLLSVGSPLIALAMVAVVRLLATRLLNGSALLNARVVTLPFHLGLGGE